MLELPNAPINDADETVDSARAFSRNGWSA
jgi:hypothetical protein